MRTLKHGSIARARGVSVESTTHPSEHPAGCLFEFSMMTYEAQ